GHLANSVITDARIKASDVISSYRGIKGCQIVAGSGAIDLRETTAGVKGLAVGAKRKTACNIINIGIKTSHVAGVESSVEGGQTVAGNGTVYLGKTAAY